MNCIAKANGKNGPLTNILLHGRLTGDDCIVLVGYHQVICPTRGISEDLDGERERMEEDIC